MQLPATLWAALALPPYAYFFAGNGVAVGRLLFKRFMVWMRCLWEKGERGGGRERERPAETIETSHQSAAQRAASVWSRTRDAICMIS